MRRRKKTTRKVEIDELVLSKVNLNAAGIDIAAEEHWVAVPADRDEQPVRKFGVTTGELRTLVTWLVECGITDVAMESTGMYWIPLFELLEEANLNPILVHPSHIKQFSGRKTDALDCQWIQTLLSYGLLRACFRPSKEICELRTYMRQRDVLIKQSTINIQQMQKALDQMNVLVHRAVSDITGKTGLKIIKAIVGGEHNPKNLAKLRHGTCRKSEKQIAQALDGNFLPQHLFCLEQALENYQHLRGQLEKCEKALEKALKTLELKLEDPEIQQIKALAGKKPKPKGNDLNIDMDHYLIGMTGVDLTRIESIGTLTAATLILEIGTDMSLWPTSKHFCSWLALCPGNHKSGGKQKCGKSRKSANRVANALRVAAQSLQWSKSDLGNWYRRMRSRLGPAQAITAAAHKLARIIYRMLSDGTEYQPEIHAENEKAVLDRKVRRLTNKANSMGLAVIDGAVLEYLAPLIDKLKEGEIPENLLVDNSLSGVIPEIVS